MSSCESYIYGGASYSIVVGGKSSLIGPANFDYKDFPNITSWYGILVIEMSYVDLTGSLKRTDFLHVDDYLYKLDTPVSVISSARSIDLSNESFSTFDNEDEYSVLISNLKEIIFDNSLCWVDIPDSEYRQIRKGAYTRGLDIADIGKDTISPDSVFVLINQTHSSDVVP